MHFVIAFWFYPFLSYLGIIMKECIYDIYVFFDVDAGIVFLDSEAQNNL